VLAACIACIARGEDPPPERIRIALQAGCDRSGDSRAHARVRAPPRGCKSRACILENEDARRRVSRIHGRTSALDPRSMRILLLSLVAGAVMATADFAA